MSRACGETIGPRIRICPFVAASGRCSGSNRPDQHNGSCPSMPQSRTRSTSNAISFPAIRSALSEAKRFRIGGRRLRPEQEPSPSTLVRPEPSSRDNPAAGSGASDRGSPASGTTPALRQVRERTLRASQLRHTEAPAIDALALHRACSRSPRTTRFSVELGRSCRPPGGVPLRAPLTDLLAFPLAITRKPPPLITRNDNKPMRGGRRK